MRKVWLGLALSVLLLTGVPGRAIPPVLFEPSEVGTFAVGSAPAAAGQFIAGQRVFIGNTGSGTVTMYNELSGDVAATTPVGPAPQGIAIDQLAARVYVSIGESNRVAVLNAFSGALIGSITIPQCTGPVGPWGIAVHQLTGTVYVACYSANRVVAFNGSTGAILASALMGGGPIGVAVDSITNLVYVSQFGAFELRVLNATTLVRVAGVTNGIRPGIHSVTLDPVLHRVWAANYFDGTIQQIVGSRVVSVYAGFAAPQWIAYSSSHDRVWIPESGSNRVTALDPLLGTITPVAVSGGQPSAVAVNPLGFVYATNFGSLSVSVILE